jgi:hypothetical protein
MHKLLKLIFGIKLHMFQTVPLSIIRSFFTLRTANLYETVAYAGIFFGTEGSTNSVEDRGQREQGSGGHSPIVRGSGGSCNLVQEISFHVVKFS